MHIPKLGYPAWILQEEQDFFFSPVSFTPGNRETIEQQFYSYS